MKAQNRKYNYYRSPKTTQERRDSCDDEHKDLVRPSRNYSNLPNSWDDINIHHNKTWKDKRKQQYNPGGRGKKRVIKVVNYFRRHKIEDFLKENEIPYKIRMLGYDGTFKCLRNRIYEIIYWSHKPIDITRLVVPDGQE